MLYNFEKIINRQNIGSSKWDQVAADMGPGSEDVIPVSVADMEFEIAPQIVDAVKKSADMAIYGYTNAQDSYYSAVIGWMERHHNWNIKKEWIVTCPGVIPALFTAVRALTNQGDGVLIQPPVYYPFPMAISQSLRNVVENRLIEKDGVYCIDFEDLENKLSQPKTTMMILCSPHNPIARVWKYEELLKIGELCIRHNVIMVVDEIHFDLIYKPNVHTVFASICKEFSDKSVILTAPSKTFNIAGLQCANTIISNPDMRQKFLKANADVGLRRLNYFAFPACEAAYNQGEEWLSQLLKILEENKQMVERFLKENLPQLRLSKVEGTYFAWVDCRALNLPDKSMEAMFRNKGRIYLDEGYLFGNGGSGFERINMACPPMMLKEVLQRMEKTVQSL